MVTDNALVQAAMGGYPDLTYAGGYGLLGPAVDMAGNVSQYRLGRGQLAQGYADALFARRMQLAQLAQDPYNPIAYLEAMAQTGAPVSMLGRMTPLTPVVPQPAPTAADQYVMDFLQHPEAEPSDVQRVRDAYARDPEAAARYFGASEQARRNLAGMAGGGSLMLRRPAVVMDAWSGKPLATLAENGRELMRETSTGVRAVPQPGVSRQLGRERQRAIVQMALGRMAQPAQQPAPDMQTRFQSAYNARVGSPAYDQALDLNADGRISILDVSRWAKTQQPLVGMAGGGKFYGFDTPEQAMAFAAATKGQTQQQVLAAAQRPSGTYQYGAKRYDFSTIPGLNPDGSVTAYGTTVRANPGESQDAFLQRIGGWAAQGENDKLVRKYGPYSGVTYTPGVGETDYRGLPKEQNKALMSALGSTAQAAAASTGTGATGGATTGGGTGPTSQQALAKELAGALATVEGVPFELVDKLGRGEMISVNDIPPQLWPRLAPRTRAILIGYLQSAGYGGQQDIADAIERQTPGGYF